MQNDFGPLPQDDGNARIQRRSLQKLQQDVPVNDFLLRDVRQDDFGIDLNLEILVNEHATNMYAQIQLKGTTKPTILADGMRSLEVDVANLNYLLNGTCPMYILHDQVDDNLFYCWAHEENARISAINPDWKAQRRISLRFSKIFTSELNLIREKIRLEHKATREINQIIARSSVTSEAQISVNVGTFVVSSDHDAAIAIESGGVRMILMGQSREVLELSQRCDNIAPSAKRLLVLSLALVSVGRYSESAIQLAKLSSKIIQLPANEVALYKWLKSRINNFSLGSDDRPIIDVGEDIYRDLDNEFVVISKLEQLRNEVVVDEGKAEKLEELVAFVNSIMESSEDVGLKLQAQKSMLYANGNIVAHSFLSGMCTLRSRQRINLAVSDNAIKLLLAPILIWSRQVEVISKAIGELGLPVLEADTKVESAAVMMLIHSSLEAFAVDNSVIAEPPGLRSSITEAREIYDQFQSIEGQLRTDLLLCDLDIINGKSDDAIRRAESVLELALAYGISAVVSLAQDHVEGSSLIQSVRHMRSTAESGSFNFIANADDDEIERTANHFMRVLDLPSNRLSVMMDEVRSHRGIAIEQRDWCRHLDLLQDLTHTKLKATAYAEALKYSCQCNKLDLRLNSDSLDWSDAIEQFKVTYCQDCLLRSPKQ